MLSCWLMFSHLFTLFSLIVLHNAACKKMCIFLRIWKGVNCWTFFKLPAPVLPKLLPTAVRFERARCFGICFLATLRVWSRGSCADKNSKSECSKYFLTQISSLTSSYVVKQFFLQTSMQKWMCFQRLQLLRIQPTLHFTDSFFKSRCALGIREHPKHHKL